MKTETSLQSIAIADLHYTPDRRDMGDLKALAASIKAHGLQVPLVVRDHKREDLIDGWIVVDGRRRLEAAKLAGLDELPCIVTTDANPDISLILNTHRLNLSPIEMLDAIRVLIPEGTAGSWAENYMPSPEDVKATAAKVNLSIEDTLKLLTLNRCGEDIKELVHSKKMSLNIAILSVNLNEKQRAEFAKYCLADRPSYRDAKRWLVNNKGSQNLRDAEFDTKGCKGCQYHGDNNPALFDQDELGQVTSDTEQSQCFNPECYKKKLADFHDGMKLKAQKLGLKKAGISSQDRWNMDGLAEFAVAERIEPDKCADCKLVKWCKGTPTKGKYVLYCPTACPNIKQPKGKKAETPRGQCQPSLSEKVEKGLPLSTEDKKALRYQTESTAARIILAKNLFGLKYDGSSYLMNVKLKWTISLDPIAVIKALFFCKGEVDFEEEAFRAVEKDHKKDPAGFIMGSDLKDLLPYLSGLLAKNLSFCFEDYDLEECRNLSIVLSGKEIEQEAITAIIPDKIKKLLTPAKAEPAKAPAKPGSGKKPKKGAK